MSEILLMLEHPKMPWTLLSDVGVRGPFRMFVCVSGLTQMAMGGLESSNSARPSCTGVATNGNEWQQGTYRPLIMQALPLLPSERRQNFFLRARQLDVLEPNHTPPTKARHDYNNCKPPLLPLLPRHSQRHANAKLFVYSSYLLQ